MSDCLFCKIAQKEIPNHTVYEDDYVLAFLDIHPCAKGHTVVIPKKHVVNLAEIGADDWNNLAVGLRQAIDRVRAVIKPDGLNVGLNDNLVAGQAVPHLHWHIIPRWENDGGGSIHSIIRTKEEVNVKAVAEMFK